MMQLSGEHHSYLVKEHLIGAGVLNLVLNAALAWAMFRGAPTVGLWDDPGAMTDLIATAFILPVTLWLITTLIVRRHVAQGKVAPAELASRWLRLLPRNLLLRSLVVGVIATVLCTPGILLALSLVPGEQLSLPFYVLLKAVFSATLAAALAPLAALCVLGSEPHGRATLGA